MDKKNIPILHPGMQVDVFNARGSIRQGRVEVDITDLPKKCRKTRGMGNLLHWVREKDNVPHNNIVMEHQGFIGPAAPVNTIKHY